MSEFRMSSGVVLGKSLDGKVMTSDGPENVLVMGPARCGKGVNTVIPTALTWKGSAFFLDYKGEIWHLTSGYRKNILGQEVIKIDPASIQEEKMDEVIDNAIKTFCEPDRDVSLYLSGSIKDILATKEVVRTFVDKLLQALLSDAFEQKKEKTLLLLDEFSQLGYMRSLEIALAIIAGKGVKMCLVCQDVNQIYGNQIYGAQGVMSNCHVQVHFTPSDSATAKIISETLGTETINDEHRAIMTPDEVARLDKEKVLLAVSGQKVMLLDKIRYYMDEELSGRATEPPQA